jgi:hypothetical protein
MRFVKEATNFILGYHKNAEAQAGVWEEARRAMYTEIKIADENKMKTDSLILSIVSSSSVLSLQFQESFPCHAQC